MTRTLLRITLLTLFLAAFTGTYQQAKACDTTPVISASNVQNIGGGNYTADFQVCIGINGSANGFDLTIGCGLNILSTSAPTLTNGARSASASIAGSTITYGCTNCSGANWFETDDFTAGPCFNFTLTLNGNPENCNFTVTGINSGCEIIQTSWSGTVPGPCLTDFSVTGAGTYPGNTSGAGNDCNLRSSNEQVFTVNLPCNDLWTFSLCGSASWDTYIYLATACCSGTITSNDDACSLQSEVSSLIGPGTYYVIVEAFSSGSGSYSLTISGANGCPLDENAASLVASPIAESKSIRLNMTVPPEVNAETVMLERQTAPDFWVRIAEFDAASGAQTLFYHDDENVKSGEPYYYRLHIHTAAGESIETTPVMAILTEDGRAALGDPFPNPGNGMFTLPVTTQDDVELRTSLVDATGREVAQKRVSVHPGQNNVIMNFADLPAGMYFLRVMDDRGLVGSRRVIIR